MISNYLNQTITWYKATGQLDAYAAPSFTQRQIKARLEFKRRLVRNKEGREVTSECRIFCKEPIQAGDKIEYGGVIQTVITHSIVPGLNGLEQFREVYV